MNSTAIATIDLSALTHNLSTLRAMMPHKKILAMIKSNAYGHGLISVARAFSQADAFGVATIAESVQLRQAGILHDLLVMRGFVTAEEMTVFFEDPQLIACIHSPHQLQLLSQHRDDKKKLRAWVKVDTGMHRLGFAARDFQSVLSTLEKMPCVEKDFVVCTHLADADNRDHTFTNNQFLQFEKMMQNCAHEKSALNSAGILAHADHAYDWIRPGLMLYGVSPFDYSGAHDAIMKSFIPVMTLESKLIAIKNVSAGEKIGYSCTYTAPRDMKIGIVGMGYGDSYPRAAKNPTPVLIRGQRCPIVGRVSMDMITVDVSHLSQVEINDAVILWGKELLVSEIAQHVNTVSHELLCHLTGRVQVITV